MQTLPDLTPKTRNGDTPLPDPGLTHLPLSMGQAWWLAHSCHLAAQDTFITTCPLS